MSHQTLSAKESKTKIIEYQKPRRAEYDTTGGIPSHWVWNLHQQGGATHVSVLLDYTMPGSLLGALMNKLVIEKQNEKAIEKQLANLKRIAEGT